MSHTKAEDLPPRLHVYTTIQARELAGVGPRRIWEWISWRAISPSVARANGLDAVNLWSAEDVLCLALLRELTDLGLEIDVLAELEAGLRRVVREYDADGERHCVVVSRSPVSVSLGDGHGSVGNNAVVSCWVVDLAKVSAALLPFRSRSIRRLKLVGG